MTPQMTNDSREAAYWRLALSWIEILLLNVAFILIFLLHLEPVLNSKFAIPLTVILAAMSYLSPVTGFLFIACSQYLPFPEEASLNPSQIGFLTWLPVVLVRYSCVRLEGLWKLWPVLPCLTWYMLMTGEQLYMPGNSYFRALCYAVIACQLTNESRGQHLKCLFGLCLGAFLIMIAFWAEHLGFRVDISDWGDSREGIARMGGTRADSVMVWPALLIGFAGFIGLHLALGSARSPRPSPVWLTWLTVILCVASLPVLISTMSQGAILSFALLAVGILAVFVQGIWSGRFTPRLVRHGVIFVTVAALLATTCYTNDILSVRTKTMAMEDYYIQESKATSLFTSRRDVWVYAIRTIMKYPVYGVVNSHEPEDIPPEYTDNPEGYVAHNVFLDFGRCGGILGMALLAFFFFFPAIKMVLSGEEICYAPFLLTHLALFVFWMSLSFVHYKSFWAFWMLAAMTVPSCPKNSGPSPRISLKVAQEAISTKFAEN